MAADSRDIGALLDGWRRDGLDRVDPLRFHRIAALHRRATSHGGAARKALDTLLAGLIDGYAAQLDAQRTDRRDADTGSSNADQASGAGYATPAATVRGSARSALGTLVDGMTVCAAAAGDGSTSSPQRTGYPQLAALEDARQLWSTLRTGSQIRRSLAPLTEDAGPLNSSRLVHRSLTLMRGLSPAYLQHFLAYADTLSWLETLQDAGVLAGKEVSQPVGAKPRRPRTRKRG